MDELDRFRDFRRGVASPTGDAHRRGSARLASTIDRDRAPRSGALGLFRKRPGYIALAFAALAGAAAAALFVSTPWKSSPGFLERAQAALTVPAGTILHQKWEATLTLMTGPACKVTLGPSELWVDQTPPHRYRAFLTDLASDPAHADRPFCSSGTATELGGALDTNQTLMFVPPNTLTSTYGGLPLQFEFPPDPVADLREAISAGIAHDEGAAQLDGRTVELIRIDSRPPSDCPDPCPSQPSYMYVHPQTYYPVQLESSLYITTPSEPWVRFRSIWRFVTFEYLPRTAPNLALTDIEAQHPNATP